MRWNLFAELLDKFEFFVPYCFDEEYELDEVFHVASCWLKVELKCRCCDDECYDVAYNCLCQRVREMYDLFILGERLKALEEKVALLDNGDTTWVK